VCTCSCSDAQVSRDQRVRGLESKECSTLGTALSPLFIEVENHRAVVMLERLLRERAKRRWGSLEPVSLATCAPFTEKGGTTSKFAKRGVGLEIVLGLSN